MADRRFPICGTTVPPNLGREAVVNRMMASLTKPAPDHLQVIGARFSGKTVLLGELARRLAAQGKPYSAILLWDLGHQTPTEDQQFMQRLAHELVRALKVNHPEYADHLDSAQSNPYTEIMEVLDALHDEGGKVLAILDGFDRAMANGRLSRNLWDQMRELASRPSLRLVTASRRTLRELIRHPDAQTSDFWNIFDPIPVRLGCFDDQDLGAVLARLPEINLSHGASTELWNASNGSPVLTLEVLNTLANNGAVGTVSAESLLSACDAAYSALQDKIDALWEDCPPTSQDLFRQVREQGQIPRASVLPADADVLLERGFVYQTKNRLQRPSRLVERYLDDHRPNEGSAMARLFGVPDAYQKNMRGVLERRIMQINGVDASLQRYLQRGIEDLPEHPELFLANVRGIVNQAFELIWRAEITDKRIPSGWMSIWKHNQERGVFDWEATFPKDGHRVRLMNLMTGTKNSQPVARYITKGTYVLMNGVQAFGDFGQHSEGAPIDAGTAYAALHLSIELAAALARELPPPTT